MNIIIIRPAAESDAERLVALRRQLFAETSFMLWEPNEFKATAEDESKFLKRMLASENSSLFVAEHQAALIGFIGAIGWERARLRHSALLALGVARAFWSQGVASRMLAEVIAWAKAIKLKRLELTVQTHNAKAVALYQRHGFIIEGTRRCSMRIDGHYVDEYLMSRIAEAAHDPNVPTHRRHEAYLSR